MKEDFRSAISEKNTSFVMEKQSCQVCSAEDSLHLCQCNKVSYCTTEHQKVDWPRHEEDCYPARIERNEVFGRFLVATRDIKQGEIIFHEKPLMIGPGANFACDLMPLCLSCYKQVESSYICTLCKWPMCGPECEQLSQHRDFECGVLAKNNIPPVKKPFEYIYINVLRCLLMRKSDPATWAKIMDMEPHSHARLMSRNSISVFGLVWNFIESTCNLIEFDGAVIRQVLGAIEVNIHHFSDSKEDAGFVREGRFLFSKLSILSHDCIPNTTWRRNKEKESKFSVTLYASIPIKKGEKICSRYANIIKDTVSRRKYLKDGYYFDCKCNRCSSESELGTYYSAIKCPWKSCSGYLLPRGNLVPIDTDSNATEPIWKCQECSLLKDYAFVCKVERALSQDYMSIPAEEKTFENLQKLEEFVNHHAKYSVHPNYYFLVQIKYSIAKILNFLLISAKDREEVTNTQILCRKQIELCESLLKVMNILCPGYSLERGRLLFYLHYAKFSLILQEYTNEGSENNFTSKKCIIDKEFYSQVFSLGQEAIEISKLAPEESELRKMGNTVRKNFSFLLKLFENNNEKLKDLNYLDNLKKSREFHTETSCN